MLDRSPTNANRGCCNACASMMKKDDRQLRKRDKISREKQKMKAKKENWTKILAIAVDQSIIGQKTNLRINLKASRDFFG